MVYRHGNDTFAERKEVIYYLFATAIVEGKLHLRLHVCVTGMTRAFLKGLLASKVTSALPITLDKVNSAKSIPLLLAQN